jgi:hypothetical protein
VETLTKQEWLTIVQWLKLRFTSIKWNDQEVRSLYDDFKEFDGELLWEACNLCYDNNTEFMNASKLRSMCKELVTNGYGKKEPALTMGNVVELNKGSLLDFLKANGYESSAHAAWDYKMKRLKAGQALKTEDTDWDTEEPWEVAKERWLQVFSWNTTVEELERKRYGDKQ